MKSQVDWSNSFEQGLLNAYVSASSYESDDAARPRLIANEKQLGENLLSVIKEQLSACRSFDFCVAFVAESGLQPLIEILSDLRSRGIKGRFLTSTYLSFNSPSVYSKLLEYDNIEVRVYEGNLHAKGYIFDQGETNTVIVGSSNLTQTALTCNKEWNILFRSYDDGSMLASLASEFNSLWTDANTKKLSPEWIEQYQPVWESGHSQRSSQATFRSSDKTTVLNYQTSQPITPNKMQERALEALRAIHRHGDPRALLVSATGTGKTYLSAFDIADTRPKRVLFLVHRQRILDASKKSFEKLLGATYTCGCYKPNGQENDATCLFAMCSTMVLHLNEFAKDAFDYIVIDEAHRAGSTSYQKIVEYFTPNFYLGMTATPTRTDGYDIFALFNHVIAFQITLQDALENDMLAPFHYFGIADLSIDDKDVDDKSLFSKLTSQERVRHIVEKIEEYTIDKKDRRGLIFCNRNEEAQLLSKQFNDLGYRTLAISGASSDAERDNAISRLEFGELEYIFSVDIFNEGVDIPTLNQIIMLRRTDSAIVFVQQLGRGLRKVEGKDFTLVLDFIGNYQKNFFVPVALSGDKTYNKDRLRRIVQEGDTIIPGCSTVSFDRISEARIYKAIDKGNFTAARFLKNEYLDLRQQLGHIPTLKEFDSNGSIDPLLIFKKYGSYHAFLTKNEESYNVSFSATQLNILEFISKRLADGRRPEELFILKSLIKANKAEDNASVLMAKNQNDKARIAAFNSALAFLDGTYLVKNNCTPLIFREDGVVELSSAFIDALLDEVFKQQILEVLDFGLRRQSSQYGSTYKDTSFVLYEKYSYDDVFHLLNWPREITNKLNVGGYLYNKETNTLPVFVNYDKKADTEASIAYEDRFISDSEIIALSKHPRTLTSSDIVRLQDWPGNGLKIYLFMRKNRADKDYFFMGEIFPTGDFKQIKMRETNADAVEIRYKLDCPVRHDIYEFMLSDLDIAEQD